MTTILSVRALAAFAERRVRAYGATPEDEVLAVLERHGATADRARDAVRLGLLRGRLVRRTGDEGASVLVPPMDWKSAA